MEKLPKKIKREERYQVPVSRAAKLYFLDMHNQSRGTKTFIQIVDELIAKAAYTDERLDVAKKGVGR